MINVALAIAVGLIAVVCVAATFTRETAERETSIREKSLMQKNIDDFLYRLDATRERRYRNADNQGILQRINDFRNDWYSYYNEYSDNFALD